MDSLVAAVIHDAKNALNTLNVRLDQARQLAPSPPLEQATAIVANLSTRLVELLAFYRADQGTLRMAVEDQNLTDFIDDLQQELAAEPDLPITLEWDIAGAQAIGAWAFDAYLVKVALLDALRNALRHARHRVSLSVTAEPGGGIRLSVADDGPGYPAEILAGESNLAMAKGSSGLGLRFAALIAERHCTPQGRRGRLALANNQGAIFSLILP
ncbi:sensor histidine kinase [Denitratisoma oestradiolicum]|uniref:histidine kinase n=1 Tax=Denitratisoma oestradiolicum TaxID=311182 RepID=A0A6S6YJB0_9PROT|nr:HAMP domain-containing sensor histidine kinase [Denitratisoma oestradiolicum]TWO81138.1 hypothetical protein CBW56_05900 [Denitratisoma oestradiolicum]CAB1367824.1 conserved protein of unknown function [Denitratisoma oestradiolicum]